MFGRNNISIKQKFPNDEFVFEFNGAEYFGIPWKSYLAGEFLSACQIGLLGNVTGNLRAVTVNWEFAKKNYFLHFKAVFYHEPTDEDKDALSSAFSEAISRMPNISNTAINFDIKEEFIVTPKSEKVEPLKNFVFLKQD